MSADATLLIGGDVVVPAPTGVSVLPDGHVLVTGDRISSVGPATQAPSADKSTMTLDVSGCVVVPGFVNTHQHHWYLLAKGLGDGLLLERWIRDLLFPLSRELTADDLRVASELACLDMLRSGTTTCLNHMVTETTEEELAAVLEPVVESGMRQVHAMALRPRALPQGLHDARAAHGRWNGAGGGRVRIGLAIEATAHWVAAGTTSDELVGEGHALAHELGAHITSHVAAGTMARDEGYLRWVLETGRTDIEHLHNLGALDERWVLAHAINLRDRDIELIAESGSTVSHTPTAEASRGGGITPVRRLLDAGVKVALGTDGAMVDASTDMLEQAKIARLMQNQLRLDPLGLTAEQVVDMGTRAGAAAVGWAEIGTIEPGKKADLAVFDLATPHSAVVHRPLSALVSSARASDARHVFVDGQALVLDGRLCRRDRLRVTELLDAAGDHGRRLARRAGLLR